MFNGLNYKWNLDKKNTAEVYYLKKKHYLKINGVDFEHLNSQCAGKYKGGDVKKRKDVDIEDL